MSAQAEHMKQFVEELATIIGGTRKAAKSTKVAITGRQQAPETKAPADVSLSKPVAVKAIVKKAAPKGNGVHRTTRDVLPGNGSKAPAPETPSGGNGRFLKFGEGQAFVGLSLSFRTEQPRRSSRSRSRASHLFPVTPRTMQKSFRNRYTTSSNYTGFGPISLPALPIRIAFHLPPNILQDCRGMSSEISFRSRMCY